jgi:surfactin synthase thioesterase subunit
MKDETIRLFCLPFAGGNSYAYRDWAQHIADRIEVIPVELPGRGKRAGEDLLLSMDALVDDALRQLRPALREPYAFYGHSMGACLAYLLTRAALANSLPPPIHLFCTGRNAPSVMGDYRDRHLLPKAVFIEELRAMGGCPEAILNDDDLMDYFLPILRADFQAHASYVYRPELPLDIPVTVMMGMEDAETERAAVLDWQRETKHPLDVVEFSGGHFFIADHLSAIGRHISEKLR